MIKLASRLLATRIFFSCTYVSLINISYPLELWFLLAARRSVGEVSSGFCVAFKLQDVR